MLPTREKCSYCFLNLIKSPVAVGEYGSNGSRASVYGGVPYSQGLRQRPWLRSALVHVLTKVYAKREWHSILRKRLVEGEREMADDAKQA